MINIYKTNTVILITYRRVFYINILIFYINMYIFYTFFSIIYIIYHNTLIQ